MDLYRYAGVGGQSKKQFIAGRPGVGGVGGVLHGKQKQPSGPPSPTSINMFRSCLQINFQPSTSTLKSLTICLPICFHLTCTMCNCCTCIQLFLDIDYFPLLMNVLIAPSSHWQIQSDVDVHVFLNCHLLIHILA